MNSVKKCTFLILMIFFARITICMEEAQVKASAEYTLTYPWAKNIEKVKEIIKIAQESGEQKKLVYKGIDAFFDPATKKVTLTSKQFQAIIGFEHFLQSIETPSKDYQWQEIESLGYCNLQ